MADINDIINGLVDTDEAIINKLQELDDTKLSQEDLDNIDLSAYQTKTATTLSTTNKNISSAINELKDKENTSVNSINSSINTLNNSINSFNSSNSTAHTNLDSQITAQTSNINSFEQELNSKIDTSLSLAPAKLLTYSYDNSGIVKFSLSSSRACSVYAVVDGVRTFVNSLTVSEISSSTFTLSPANYKKTSSRYWYVEITDGYVVLRTPDYHFDAPEIYTLKYYTSSSTYTTTGIDDSYYADDCANFKPASVTGSLGDWENTFLWQGIQPVLLTSNGSYINLNKKDLTRTEDGRNISSISYTDVLVRIPKFYIKFSSNSFSISNQKVDSSYSDAWFKSGNVTADYIYVGSYVCNTSGYSRPGTPYMFQLVTENPSTELLKKRRTVPATSFSGPRVLQWHTYLAITHLTRLFLKMRYLFNVFNNNPYYNGFYCDFQEISATSTQIKNMFDIGVGYVTLLGIHFRFPTNINYAEVFEGIVYLLWYDYQGTSVTSYSVDPTHTTNRSCLMTDDYATPEDFHYTTKPSYDGFTIVGYNSAAINLSNTIHGYLTGVRGIDYIIKQNTLVTIADWSSVIYGLCTLSLFKGLDSLALRGCGDSCSLRIQYYA